MFKPQAAITAFLVFCLFAAALPGHAAEAGKVNVNQASADQLMLLPRVGASLAGRILEFRKENGPFKTVEDLLQVKGVGEKTLDLLKPYVALSGETTLKEKVRASRVAGAEQAS